VFKINNLIRNIPMRKTLLSAVREGRARAALAMACALASLLSANPTAAARFPDKPVRLVTSYPPGGGTDAVARPIAASFSKAWGQPVVVDNRGSGGGVIAHQMVAHAPPDGYTLFLSTGAGMVSAPLAMGAVGYDPNKDFSPVGLVALLPAFLVAQSTLPANTLQDVIALARGSPGKYAFSSSGTGGGHHFAVEMLKSLTGVDVIHVPYKGGGPAIVALLSNEVTFTFCNFPAARPHLGAGRLKAIASAGAKRSSLLPQTPTMIESGLPGFQYTTWYGFYVPARTPRAIIDLINAELHRALADRGIAEPLLAQGAEASPSTPEALTRLMRDEHARWMKVIRSQKLKF
jgi:tripartite-type tricarboxylate transporter receptor subunit TctC